MKIQVANVDDFLGELHCESTRVKNGVVRFQVYRTPEQDERVSFDVAVLATAILTDDDKRPVAILEYIEACGRDSRKEVDAGSRRAAEIELRIREACGSLNLSVRPGKFELFY